MNLTSKRMLQFLTVCAGACALTASAQTTWVSDNFEAEGDGYSNGVPGMAAATYKMAVWGAQNQYTNVSWFATSGEDASIITNISNSSYALDSRPITGSATANILQLNTEGQTLSRYVSLVETNAETGQMGPTSVSFGSAPVYVDTMIQFTPSEDAPSIETGVKIAVWVDVNSNLVVNHRFTDGNSFFVTNSIFTALGTISPDSWHRLTIKLSKPSSWGGGITAFELWLDGNQLSHANGAVNTETYTGGTWFFPLNNDPNLSQVSFQGTGAVDELVVTDITPTHNTTGLLLTLAFNDDVLNVFVDSAAVTNGEQIASGSEVTMYTIDWYQLNSITGTGITTNLVSGTIGGNMSTNAVVEITADEAGRTATINVGQFTGTIPTGLPGAYATVPADKLSAWAVNSGLSINQVVANASDYLDNYLLNVDETTTATLKITSIVYDAGTETATITVGATSDAEAVDFTSINGELVVWTSDNLVDWGEPITYPFTIQSTTPTSVEIDVPKLAGKFIKARVE